MILRVVKYNGDVLHDCKENGCETSWDGYDISTGLPVAGGPSVIPSAYIVGKDNVAVLQKEK